jgi:hypothetical protein
VHPYGEVSPYVLSPAPKRPPVTIYGWRTRDIAEYSGTDLFSPRDIATQLAAPIAGDIPDTPVMLGL